MKILGALLKTALLVTFLGIAFWAGTHLGHEAPTSTTAAIDHGDDVHDDEEDVAFWTCAMHPSVNLPHPGKCPICFMDLIPVAASDNPGTDKAPRITFTNVAKSLAQVETAEVIRKSVFISVRMVGSVVYDETHISTITSWVEGRLQRMFVDFTGIPIQQGEHMVQIYSPELLTAQEELLEALRSLQKLPDDRFALLSLNAARERLRLWGLTDKQIREIEDLGIASEYVTIFAPTSGVVVEKNGVEGMFVREGTPLYTIADLDRLWIKLDAYESDLTWLRLGQVVEFEVDTYPGEIFTGRIGFIDPILDVNTRTVAVRINVNNEDGRLKPGMFVRAIVHSEVADRGVVIDSYLADKWMCPMHPDVVKEESGDCDECEMPLVPSATLGFSPSVANAQLPLVIPDTAPLLTGTRAVVYVEVPDQEFPTYEGRVIQLGPKAGSHYLVDEGLEEGERVVVRGNFKIDSSLQIRAKPSMMSVPSDPAPADGFLDSPDQEEDSGQAIARQFPSFSSTDADAVVDAYLILQSSLADDDSSGARQASMILHTVITALDGDELGKTNLDEAVAETVDAGDNIERLRVAFRLVSDALPDVLALQSPSNREEVLMVFCSMAFDDTGASWYQVGEVVMNPYFGSQMLHCGTVIEDE